MSSDPAGHSNSTWSVQYKKWIFISWCKGKYPSGWELVESLISWVAGTRPKQVLGTCYSMHRKVWAVPRNLKCEKSEGQETRTELKGEVNKALNMRWRIWNSALWAWKFVNISLLPQNYFSKSLLPSLNYISFDKRLPRSWRWGYLLCLKPCFTVHIWNFCDFTYICKFFWEQWESVCCHVFFFSY